MRVPYPTDPHDSTLPGGIPNSTQRSDGEEMAEPCMQTRGGATGSSRQKRQESEGEVRRRGRSGTRGGMRERDGGARSQREGREQPDEEVRSPVRTAVRRGWPVGRESSSRVGSILSQIRAEKISHCRVR